MSDKICNTDEPYADQVLEAILGGESVKRKKQNG